MFLDLLSKYLLIVILSMILFLIGVQVGKKLPRSDQSQIRTVDIEQGKITIQITIT